MILAARTVLSARLTAIAALALLLLPAWASSQGHWTTLDVPMTTPRDAASAILIDGRILIIGGRTRASGRTTGAAEWFAPQDRSAAPAPQMRGSRSFCPQVLLRDGSLLLPGGFRQIRRDTTIRSSDLFEPRTGGWRATGDLLVPRELHSATLLPDNTVLIAGGFSNGKILASAEIYRPDHHRYSPSAPLQTPRFGHAAIVTADTLLVLGGRTDHDVSLRSTEKYDFRARSWTLGPTMVSDRFRHTATRLRDGRILVTGGYSSRDRKTLDTAEIYDPTTATFTLLTSHMTDGRMDHTATLLADGRVLICGGWCSTKGRTVASADLFDPHTNTFKSTDPLPCSRHEQAAVPLPDGTVLVAGGLRVEPGNEITLDDLVLYSP